MAARKTTEENVVTTEQVKQKGMTIALKLLEEFDKQSMPLNDAQCNLANEAVMLYQAFKD